LLTTHVVCQSLRAMTKHGLTAGEIANRIQEPGEDLRAISQRLRHWTREGLLKPIGKQNPGTGHHLRYPERALVDAAILSRLTRRFGFWAKKVPFTGALLDAVVEQLPHMRLHIQNQKIAYLFLGTRGGDFLGQVQVVDDPNGPVRRFRERLTVPPDFDDVILINLNRLFAQVGIPLDENQKGKS
jgi:hypothetical protein